VSKRKPAAKKPADKQKQAEKRARREERKAAEAVAKRAAARKKQLKKGLWIFGGVAFVAIVGFLIFQKANLAELPGVSKEDYDGRTHVVTGEAVFYETATPTSGRHSGSSPRCGIIAQPIPPEFAVHALEHGAVVIWYQQTLSQEEVSALAAVVREFDDRVILSPNPQLADPVVATSWTRLKAYAGVDDELSEFIETYRGRGPESFSCAY